MKTPAQKLLDKLDEKEKKIKEQLDQQAPEGFGISRSASFDIAQKNADADARRKKRDA